LFVLRSVSWCSRVEERREKRRVVRMEVSSLFFSFLDRMSMQGERVSVGERLRGRGFDECNDWARYADEWFRYALISFVPGPGEDPE
jgi:hypothetical protein